MVHISQSLRNILSHLLGRSVITASSSFFVLLAGYAIIRPTSQSIFLEYYGSSGLPYTWLAIALLVGLMVAANNRLIQRYKIATLFTLSVAVVSISLIIMRLTLGVEPHTAVVPFLLYTWKDIYIVLLLEQIWSFCNISFDKKAAKNLYGFFTAMGTLGAAGGNLVVKYFSQSFGSENLIIIGACLTVGSAIIFYINEHSLEERMAQKNKAIVKTKIGGNELIRTSNYLKFIALMIIVIQVVITLLDYQFNHIAQLQLPDTNTRSAFFGQFYFAINILAFIIQIAIVPVILLKAGIIKSLLISPTIFVLGFISIVLFPQLFVIAGVMVLAKSLDYSITRAAKEILYIPLSFDEKYKAKAIIDMFGYRFAKGIASIMLIGIAWFGIASTIVMQACLAAGLIIWFVTIRKIAQYKKDLEEIEPTTNMNKV